MDAGLDAEIWGFSRAVAADVEALVELGVQASVIESPVSDAKLAAYGSPAREVERRVVAAIERACEEASRSPSSASTAPVPTSPSSSASTPVPSRPAPRRSSSWTRSERPPRDGRAARLLGPRLGRHDVPVHFHGHNDFGLATAAAVAAVRAGATWIHGTINGMGERAGNANLLEVALALDALYGVATNLRLEHARETSELVRELSGYELEPWKPLVGENLFRRESGAVASQFHDPPAIEPYSSELVGAERGIVLGKKSGLDSIRIKAEELGLDVPEEPLRRAAGRRQGTRGAASAAWSPTTSSARWL